MKRFLFLAWIILGFSAVAAHAEGYLLRLDEIITILQSDGFDEIDALDKSKPKLPGLPNIEVLVHPNLPFHTKVQLHNETLLLSGKLIPSKEDGFIVEIQYRRTIDNGTMVVNEKNQRVPLFDESALRGTFGLKLDESALLGGLTKKNDTLAPQTGKKISVRTHTRYFLTLTKYEPTKE